MTAQFPLHADDALQLLKIRRYLIGFRITNGWTQKDLSQRINGTDGMVYNLESDQSWGWRLSRLQGWVKAFDLRLRMVFRSEDYSLEESVDDDPVAKVLRDLCLTQQDWPQWQRTYLTAALSAARKAQNISSERLGEMLGVSRKAVWHWESTSDEVLLTKILYHARVLGGWIEVALDDRQN